MNALHIVVDSTCDMTLEEAKALGVGVMVLKVFFGPVGYRDKIDLIGPQFFEKLRASDVMPPPRWCRRRIFWTSFRATRTRRFL